MNRKRPYFHQLSERSKRRHINVDSTSDNSSSSSSNPIYNPSPTHSNYIFESTDTDSDKLCLTNNCGLTESNEIENFVCNSSTSNNDTSEENNLPTVNNLNPLLTFNADISNNEKSSMDIKNFLRSWAIKHNITATAVTDLLTGLKNNVPCLNELPTDARTLLKTNIPLLKKVVEPGNYIHFGLEHNLKMLINSYSLNNINELNLLVNVDGLPLFKSSSGQVIPILVTIINIPHLKKTVLPVGLYYGLEKPSDMNMFLDSFITEIVELSEHGVTNNNGRLFSVKIVGFVCDAPAKKDLLGIKGHGGYFSCTKCTVRGSTVSHKRVFTDLDCTARTHEDFINWTDSNYRLRNTALIRIPEINFVNSIVLDPMHLIYLGVMRTMLTTWYQGDIPHKLSWQLIKKISDFMEIQNLPEEFVRKPRALKYLLRWKATEFRSFLLYIGPVATRGVLDREKYNNFMTLNVAISILLNPNSCGDLDLRNYARQLLRHFVQSFIEIYDNSFITHNFHGLIHLVDDADYFSSKVNEFTLDKISAFPFENYLQKIKSMVRGRNKPLEQIGNRMAELFCDFNSSLPSLTTQNQQFPILSHIHYNNGPLPLRCIGPQYKKIHFPNFSLKTELPNNCCGLDCGDIVMVENICHSIDLNCAVIIGRKFLIKRNFFKIPCDSSLIGVYEVEKLSEPELWPISFICKKYVYFKHKHIYVVFPLLHTS